MVRTIKQLIRDNATSTLAYAVDREAAAQAAAFAGPEFGARYDTWCASRTPD